MLYAIYVGMLLGTVVAALGAVFGIWAAYRYSTARSDSHFAALLIWVTGLSTLATEVFATRSPTLALGVIEGGGALESSPTMLSSWGGRISTLFLVAFAVVRLIVGGTKSQHPTFKLGIKSDNASLLFYSYILYFLLSGALSSIAGTKPAFVHLMFYPVLIFGAAYLSKSYETDFLLKHAKLVLLMLIYGSLIAAALFPKFALETGYKGLIPGLTVRLYGLASHPNTLGPAALLFLVLEYMCPSSRRSRWAHGLAAVGVVLLAQSKTNYVGLLLVSIIIFIYRYTGAAAEERHPDRRLRFLALLLFSLAMLGLSLLILQLTDLRMAVSMFDSADTRELAQLSTLTGRTVIWEITLKTWLENPLFGYGPTIWDPEFRSIYGLFHVGQAHNQFMQTLGESGIIGLLGLCFYLIMLLKIAFATVKFSRGASLALIAIPLLRTGTEAPFRNFVITDWAFFTHLLIFCLLIGLSREQRSDFEKGS